MSVTFPVANGFELATTSSYSIAMTGVTSGQPIVLTHWSWNIGIISASNVADTFSTHYTWTVVQSISEFTAITQLIGTGGAGTSGTITVTTSSGDIVAGFANACAGASTSAGLAAIDNSGKGFASATPFSISGTPTLPGEGAVFAAGVDATDSNYFTTYPGSPWASSAVLDGSVPVGIVSTQSAPTGGVALSPSWAETGTADFPVMVFLFVKAAPTAPSSPTLTSPANSSYDDVSAGQVFTGTYNSTDGYSQSYCGLRIKLSGGSYGYWNGTDFSSTVSTTKVAVTASPGGTFSVTVPTGVALPGGTLVNGHTYNWSFCSYESGATLQGAFASDFTFVAQTAPTVTVTAPTSTITISEPTATWTETLYAAAQTAYQVIVESGAYGTVPGSGVSAFNSGVVPSAALSAPISTPLANATTYRVFVQITQTGPQTSAWAYNTFTVLASAPAIPLLTALAINDPTTGLPEIQLTVVTQDNLLTANQASLESDVTTGWAAGSNTTITASATWAQAGLYSLRLAATASGAVSATTPTGTSGIAITPGEVVRAMAFFHSPTTVRACTVAIGFYNAAGGLISTSTSTSVNSTLTGNGGQPFISATAPALSAFAALIISGAGLSTSEYLYADQMLFAPGTSTLWSGGGFVGSTTVLILRSDGQLVRGAGWEGVTSIANQGAVVYDPESAPGTAYTYTATVTSGLVTGPASAATASVSTTTNAYWWIFDPTQPETICVRFLMKSNWQPIVVESGAKYMPLGNEFMIKSTDGTKGIGGIIPIYTGDSLANSLAAQELVQQVQPLCFVTPTRGIFYVMSDPGVNNRGTITPSWEVNQPQSEWQFNVLQTTRP